MQRAMSYGVASPKLATTGKRARSENLSDWPPTACTFFNRLMNPKVRLKLTMSAIPAVRTELLHLLNHLT